MKTRSLLMSFVVFIGITTLSFAQIPNYVPTNGLVGWWSFNGNANDESGNGNNGVVNGANLTSDRYGNTNNAYNFDGISNFITISNLSNIQYKPITYNLWINPNSLNTIPYPLGGGMLLIGRDWSGYYDIGCLVIWDYPAVGITNDISYYIGQTCAQTTYTPSLNNWTNVSMTLSNDDTIKFYVNGSLINSQYFPTNGSANAPFRFGAGADSNPFMGRYFYNGLLDDIGVWDRVLTEQEIADLYYSCQDSVLSQPSNQNVVINNNAQFITTSTDPSATYQWQTDLGVGFQNLTNSGQYSGVSNDTLVVSNATLSNNNQQFRCIITSNTCSDTSDVVVLSVYDNTGINNSLGSNIMSIFPNPTKDHITIDLGNYQFNDGLTLQLTNNLGQQVLSRQLTQQLTTIQLDNSMGKGIYLVNLIDSEGNIIDIRKIVLQ
jgi:hypothetical protein